jgi:CheY-like chemotaxis protein
MEAIGQLAGGIAHDFNNLLTTIQGYTDLLLTQIGPDKPMWADLHEIQAASGRAALLTQQLLAFSRRHPLDLTVVDLNDIVARLSQMMRRVISEDIEVDVALGEGRLYSKADVSRLEQVVMNLVVNARDAVSRRGGKIRIGTRLATLRADHPSGLTGAHVILEVADNGCGMDAATKTRVFEPFFTTKKSGTGTGLGLATVYGIVQQCGGQVEVESEVGRGSTFRVYLPWTEEPLRTDPSAPPVGDTLVGSEHVLIVEDSEELRTLVAHVLKRYGYSVHEAGTPEEALQIARRSDLTVDLVLMDVVMPRMTGPQVMALLRGSWPEAAVLYISGYSREALAQRDIHTDDAPFLKKPFSAANLLSSMRGLLDNPTVAEFH